MAKFEVTYSQDFPDGGLKNLEDKEEAQIDEEQLNAMERKLKENMSLIKSQIHDKEEEDIIGGKSEHEDGQGYDNYKSPDGKIKMDQQKIKNESRQVNILDHVDQTHELERQESQSSQQSNSKP